MIIGGSPISASPVSADDVAADDTRPMVVTLSQVEPLAVISQVYDNDDC